MTQPMTVEDLERLLAPFFDDETDDEPEPYEDDDDTSDDRTDEPAMFRRDTRTPEWASSFAVAVQAQALGNAAAAAERAAQLADQVGRFGSADLSQVVVDDLTRAVAGCWDRGWQPADLAHVLGRQLKRPFRRRLPDVIALEAQAYRDAPYAEPAWLAQTDAVTAGASPPDRPKLLDSWQVDFDHVRDVVYAAVVLLVALRQLPSQPRLCSPPSEWARRPRSAAPPGSAGRRTPGSAADPKIIQRVRALLAKAESTDFPDEAETFTKKAQALIARYAIDQAMLDHGSGHGPPGAIGRRVLIDDPYAKAKSVLLGVVAQANRCTTVWQPGLALSTVFGQPSDLDVVELLFSSLLTQATRAMVVAERELDLTSRERSFRHSFWVAFAGRIGERLREATAEATEEASAQHGRDVLPVLANRTGVAEAARSEVFPEVRTGTIRSSNALGWHRGRQAANEADIGRKAALKKGQ